MMASLNQTFKVSLYTSNFRELCLELTDISAAEKTANKHLKDTIIPINIYLTN